MLAVGELAADLVELLQLLLQSQALADRDGKEQNHTLGDALGYVPISRGEERLQTSDEIEESVGGNRLHFRGAVDMHGVQQELLELSLHGLFNECHESVKARFAKLMEHIL